MKQSRSERSVKDAVKRRVQSIPDIKIFPYNPFYGEAGLPDYIGVCSVRVPKWMVGRRFGIFFGLEIKRPHGKMTELQKSKRKLIRKYGGRVFRIGDAHAARHLHNFLLRKFIKEFEGE